MSNKQTSIEWLIEQGDKLTRGYLETTTQFVFRKGQLIDQAIAMHKEEIINAINEVSQNNVKYANMIIASWSQIEGELFMHNTKLAEQYYNETYGGNDE